MIVRDSGRIHPGPRGGSWAQICSARESRRQDRSHQSGRTRNGFANPAGLEAPALRQPGWPPLPWRRCEIAAAVRSSVFRGLSFSGIAVCCGAVKEKRSYWLPGLFILVFAASRIPGVLPGNFSAAYAIAFCGGLYFPGLMAWWLPLGTLLATDVLLNVCYYHEPVLSGYLLVSLLSFAALVGLGRMFSPRMSWLKLLGGGLLGAILFYLITNTASWIQNPGYAKTIAGWIQALTTGLPGFPSTWEFFKSTLLSGGLFTGLFAGAMKLTAEPESPQEKEGGVRHEAPESEEAPEDAKA